MSRARQLLTEHEQTELLQAYWETMNGPLRTRCQAVRLYGMGYRVDEIVTITGCSVSRLRSWYATYQQAGLAGLHDKRVGGNHTYLTSEQKADLAERLRLYTPAQLLGAAAATAGGQFWTVLDLQQVVARWYAVEYRSLTSYQTLFRDCDFSYQKSSNVYKSRNEQDVAEFSAALEKKDRGCDAGATGHGDSRGG
jgi:transposase